MKYHVTEDFNIIKTFETSLEALKYAFDNSEYITDDCRKNDAVTDGYGKMYLREFNELKFYCYMLELSLMINIHCNFLPKYIFYYILFFL